MEKIILDTIFDLIIGNKELLRIPIRQKAKFEGWLKFELANRLEKLGMENVEVEPKEERSKDRCDISFMRNNDYHRIELKTPNTNWKIDGIRNNSRPITKNITSIIWDAKKLNSQNGIVVFVLFPIPKNDNRWKQYIEIISNETQIEIDFKENCKIVSMDIDNKKTCDLLICSFKSRRFDNWRI